MWIEQVFLKDFRCFNGEHSIAFSTETDKNVTLIHAENGVGKTTLLNAVLWCFYGMTTPKFERREDLVNHDAVQAGRRNGYVEVMFKHNGNRYRARRYALAPGAIHQDRTFTIMRLDKGHSDQLPNPDTFINTVIPKDMATHFLFDGEHAEVFLGEENRGTIRRAVQDILGCTLIDTAIKDLNETTAYYRRQMPKAKSSEGIEKLSSHIDALTSQIDAAKLARDKIKEEIDVTNQQIADIDAKLRSSDAAKVLQSSRENIERDLSRAQKREQDAQNEVLRWLGDNGRYIVSTRITEQTFDHLNQEETKGRIPSPYNEEFVKDLLEMEHCICGSDLKPGTEQYEKVKSLLQRAANHTLRSRLSSIRARLANLKSEREKAPGKLADANQRLADARQDISRQEALRAEISAKLQGIDFEEISKREVKRNQLQKLIAEKHEHIGSFNASIADSESRKLAEEKELKRLAENDSDARIFVARYNLCEVLKKRLETELEEEEKSARGALRSSIGKILDETSRKNFRLNMTSEYAISLVNEAGTQLPKSGGENQLLGLAFTAALVEFAKNRQNSDDFRLLKGTVAPLVLDSPFGQLDDSYRRTTARYVPEMASQVVLMISGSQGSGGVLQELQGRVGKEYVLIRHNKDARGSRPPEVKQFRGKDVETARFDADFDGSSILEVS
jgi:DNA sulfur modification protein DndD